MTRPIAGNIRALTAVIAVAFLVVSLGVGYWTIVSADELSNDPFNPRLIAAARDRPRGVILDASGGELATSVAVEGSYRRSYRDRTLAQVVGYASFKFGLAGIEAAYAASLIGQDPADPLGRLRARYLREHAPPGSVALAIVPEVQRA
ncbi:MAG: hypothetical protein ACRDF0_08565, partial [Candidatus Limnocylindria bacterium]